MSLEELNRRKKKAATAEEEFQNAMRPKLELQDLIDEVPESLDSHLGHVFQDAEYVDTRESATAFGYRSMIEGRPVTPNQHEAVCRSLLSRLRKIIEWCDKYQVIPTQLTKIAKQQVIQRFGEELCNSKISPLFPLEVLDEMASGISDEALLPDLVESNVKTRFDGIRSIFEPALAAIGLGPALEKSSGSAVDGNNSSPHPVESDRLTVSRRRGPGDGAALLKSHLLQHHKFMNGAPPKIGNAKPVAVSKTLADDLDIAEGTVSKFFQDWFEGRKKYDATCQREDVGILGQALKFMSGDMTPPELRRTFEEEARSRNKGLD